MEVMLTASPEAAWREAVLLQSENRVAEAIAAYQRLLRLKPRLAEAWYNLGLLQRQVRQLDDALDSYQKALDSGIARPEEVHLNRSVIYTDHLRDHAAAERELERALALNPTFEPALLNLANLQEDLGREPEARATYARLLELDPRCFEALARYANLHSPGAHPVLVERLRRALIDPQASPAERASLGFALGRLLDAMGEFSAAFAAYELANRASRASAPAVARYDRAQQQRLTERLMATPLPARAPTPGAAPEPIFICGMFRSGSTLTEQLLAHCPGVAAGGELDFIPRLVAGELEPFPESMQRLSAADLNGLAARYRAELARLPGRPVHVIDKRPDNFLYLGFIKTLFPQARIVHTTRDPLDNCLSIYFLHLDQQMSYSLDLMDIGHYYREYRRLMSHWQRQFGADIHECNYDALVHEPLPTLEALCHFLGLEWRGQLPRPAPPNRAIKTASVWQARAPLYVTSSGRARNYRHQLSALRDYLADLS
jgi:tetratricopeptide (TPR) repeat protein